MFGLGFVGGRTQPCARFGRLDPVVRTTATARRSRPWWAALFAAGVAAAVVLHVLAGHRSPTPWPDKMDFLTPAGRLARHGTLRVPSLNAPHGVFWVPDLYYFLLAPVLRVAPLS